MTTELALVMGGLTSQRPTDRAGYLPGQDSDWNKSLDSKLRWDGNDSGSVTSLGASPTTGFLMMPRPAFDRIDN